MRAYRSVVDVMAGVAAVLFGYYGAVVMWDVILTSVEMFQFRASGGVGAVSFGVTQALLLWLPSVLANRLLARPASGLGGLFRTLHRAHSVSIVVAVLLLLGEALALSLSVVPVPAVVGAFLLLGILVALQFLLLAATLLAFVWGRHSSARFAIQD